MPPELLFGRKLGEFFISRNAGNTIDTVALGSIEYAVGSLFGPLDVVVGHERRGAAGAVVSVVEKNATFPGSSIGAMVEPIIPAVLSVRGQAGDRLDNPVRANVSRRVNHLRTATDPLMLEPQRAGRLQVFGSYDDLDVGGVDVFERPWFWTWFDGGWAEWQRGDHDQDATRRRPSRLCRRLRACGAQWSGSGRVELPACPIRLLRRRGARRGGRVGVRTHRRSRFSVGCPGPSIGGGGRRCAVGAT